MGDVHVIEVERTVRICGWRWRSMYGFKNHFFNWSTRVNNGSRGAMMVDG